MFKRIRNRFRATIAAEVAKVSVALEKERVAALASFRRTEQEVLCSFDAIQAECAARIKATLEAEHDAFVQRLRNTREHIADGEPCHWKADAETLAADDELRKAK